MFNGNYLDWNKKKIKAIVDYYGHQFMHNKKILDLGCGHADISGALYRLGADITAVDARQNHLQVAAKKFQGLKVVKADLDSSWPFRGQKFDLIVSMGLLCHLQNMETHLRTICNSTTHLVLESAVADSDELINYACPENKSIYDQAANGMGCRPSAALIEKILTECGMEFKRVDHNRFNSGQYVYDWKVGNTNQTDLNRRRIWFAVKKTASSAFVGNNIEAVVQPPQPQHVMKTAVEKPIKRQSSISAGVTKDPSKIKTALCISGHLRTFEENFKSVYHNIISKMDCDVFIHTWEELGMPYRPFDAPVAHVKSKNLEEKLKFLYNPKKLVIEPRKNFQITPLMHQRQIDHRDIGGILSMFYKVEECNELKKQYEKEFNFKYDCVIRFRGDLFVEMPIPIGTPNINNLYIPMYGNFGGINDQFAFGSSNIMDVYSSLYSNIEKYLLRGAPMHPEKLLQYHIEFNKLPVAKVHFKYVIRRPNGLVQDNFLLERAWGFVR